MTRGGTRHSLEQRLEIVTKYLNGEEPLARLSNHYHVSKSTIESWYEKYESNGIDGLKKTHNNKKYDPEFKLEMVHVVLSGEMGIRECCKKNNIPSHSILLKWMKQYNSGKAFKVIHRSDTTMKNKAKAVKTTYNQRLEIVLDAIKNGKDYQFCADKYHVSYSQVYNWVRKYERLGAEELKDRRGKSLKQQPQQILSAEQKIITTKTKIRRRETTSRSGELLSKKLRALGAKRK